MSAIVMTIVFGAVSWCRVAASLLHSGKEYWLRSVGRFADPSIQDLFSVRSSSVWYGAAGIRFTAAIQMYVRSILLQRNPQEPITVALTAHRHKNELHTLIAYTLTLV